MSGVAIDIQGMERLAARLNRLASRRSFSELLDGIGAEVESQTHRRLRDEKTSPDGEPWADWSERYAATRHGGHSLLMGEGDLDDSVQFLVEGDEVQVGTNLEYGAIHQFGGADVGKPEVEAREYLGLSEENIEDLLALIDDWADELLRD